MKILRFVFAIPIAILSSFIIPVIQSNILIFFIPWEFINVFISDYFIPFISGSIAVGLSYLIAPRYKLAYALSSFYVCLFSTYLNYTKSEGINYVFLFGSTFGLTVTLFDFFRTKDKISLDFHPSYNSTLACTDDEKLKRSYLIRKRAVKTTNNKKINMEEEISDEELTLRNIEALEKLQNDLNNRLTK